jgi:probable rRNA maturation factor
MNTQRYAVYFNAEGPFESEEAAITAAAWHALTLLQAEPCALSVTLTSAERVHELNLHYAGIDSPTDVLSFPAEDVPYAVEPGEPPYIGDIVIAYPIAEQQARAAAHSVQSELQLLTVHGTLHLMGFDHETPEQQAEMWAYQSAVMDAIRADGW